MESIEIAASVRFGEHVLHAGLMSAKKKSKSNFFVANLTNSQ